MRRILLLAVALLAVVFALPDAALAHGLVGRQDLPIPKWLFGWGASVVLVVSFVGLAVLWPQPRFEKSGERKLCDIPRFLDPLAGLIGLALFVLVIYAGYAGSQTTTNNLTPTFIFVLFWVGLVPLSVLFGDVFTAFNPWRAFGRGVAWIGQKVSKEGLPEPLPYPEKLGRWPAAIGILAFAWLELVYSNRDDPSALATFSLAYAAIQLVGMSMYGVDAWTRNGDAFGAYFGIFAKISPLRWTRKEIHRRRPLSGLTSLEMLPGTVALLVVMIGTVSFDGFSNGPVWSDLSPELTDFFRDTIGMSPKDALQAAFTVGLLMGPAVVGAFYWLGIRGMRWAGEQRSAQDLAQRFVHTLVPIAVAYVMAHYFSLLAYNGQATAYLASDPLGDGSDIFGTANSEIDYTWISATGIWYVQVAALVIGHVGGLILAHDRALVLYRNAKDATRSQYWMLAVMIAFTSLGLYLLSESS